MTAAIDFHDVMLGIIALVEQMNSILLIVAPCVLLARFMAATDTEIDCRLGVSQAMVTEMAKFADGPGHDIFPVPIFS